MERTSTPLTLSSPKQLQSFNSISDIVFSTTLSATKHKENPTLKTTTFPSCQLKTPNFLPFPLFQPNFLTNQTSFPIQQTFPHKFHINKQ